MATDRTATGNSRLAPRGGILLRFCALSWGAIIAVLGGLIGLGGAEFRLPVLVNRFGMPLRRAIPLNLIVSLATVATALTGRWWGSLLGPAWPFALEIGALVVGGVVGATVGGRWLATSSDRRLHQLVGSLLLGIALLLFAEAVLGDGFLVGLPTSMLVRGSVGLVAGLGIGIVSSLLGVAGGELLIPTFVFAFGADVKTAGAASLLVSLPTVLIGVVRHTQRSGVPSRNDLSSVAVPMIVGSVFGAFLGARLTGIVPISALKIGLGAILAVSAVRMLRDDVSMRGVRG